MCKEGLFISAREHIPLSSACNRQKEYKEWYNYRKEVYTFLLYISIEFY